MFLKQIEITGFKSFADKTRLQFEPGMISIVGPNGCGKSNVSDAIRWVLGEQRPTALRCAKMPDVIFNGTDTRKPLGLAEVSITFAECEGILATEFNEVTITRRVFRSGDGQYFINKNLCRLKDVHRLFMGTGIGTTSYSVMAQGQIDAILSSRPEDRRAVFEEAAGITKFKADRKEALRKIEQTEANLLRLADVIREVKRQIGTLQRQAGKAQTYRKLRDELRGLDIFLTRRRLAALDTRTQELDFSIQALNKQLVGHQAFVSQAEVESARIHGLIRETEERIAALAEQAAQADNRYIRAQEVIKVNQHRIAEYRAWAERDNREIATTQSQIDQLRMQIESLVQKRLLMQQAALIERAKMEEAQARFDAHQIQIDQTRTLLQEARQQSVACERRSAQIQQTLSEMESRQREVLMKRDRLASEQGQVQESLTATIQTCEEVKTRLDRCHANAESIREQFELLEAQRETVVNDLRLVQDESAQMQSEASAKRAQIELLTDKREATDEFAPGTRQILDPTNPLGLDPSTVLGPLADKFQAPSDLRLAIEVALRAWLDAVVLRDTTTARQVLGQLFSQGKQAATRIVVADEEPIATDYFAPKGLTALLDHVTVSADFKAAAQRLLGSVFLADTVGAIPETLPTGCSVVTRGGLIVHANGCAELWMPDNLVSSPLARRLLVADTTGQLTALETQIAAHRSRLEHLHVHATELTVSISQMRRELDDTRRQAAQAEGEFQTVSRDVERARVRLNVVVGELGTLKDQTSDDEETRISLTDEFNALTVTRHHVLEQTAEKSTRLQELESIYGELSHTLTECRIQNSSMAQQLEYAASQREAVETRMEELNQTLQGRARGVLSYDESISRLAQEIETLDQNLEPMRVAADALHVKMEKTRDERAEHQRKLDQTDITLTERRQVLDVARDNRGKAEIEITESRMLRQNQIDHMYNEYGLSLDELVAHADPAWENGEPLPLPIIETRVAALSAEIQALGPVNLVAIEEYKELEERYTFLKAQEHDLLKSKEQILELIAMINKKSSEMFQATFEQANINFETMFTKLFNGGQAKLILLENIEDPLESGIDIIARPPGKRPQSVTLLSGGERTMTAVSLLFAIFMIKPSPFCMLDELDAALDDSNIGRFVQVLKEFLAYSQFLIITHNQHTIAGSDIVYGVTQQEKGISKIVSMRLREIGVKELHMGAPEAVPTVEEDMTRTKRTRKIKDPIADLV